MQPLRGPPTNSARCCAVSNRPAPGVPAVLAIAGTDPTGGAGLVADIKSITALGGYAMGVVSAITAQNTTGVQGVYPQPAAIVTAQLASVSADVRIDAVKIGMLGEPDIVAAVLEWVRATEPAHVVLDPVMVATTGGVLSTDAATQRLVDLAREASLITPNVPELAALVDAPVPQTLDEVAALAATAHERLGVSVLATTGDLADASHADILVETTATGTHVTHLDFSRIATPHTHGTGCSLSSALATTRTTTESWHAAYARVRPWLDGALRGGLDLHIGHGSGPLDHNWFLHGGPGGTTPHASPHTTAYTTAYTTP